MHASERQRRTLLVVTAAAVTAAVGLGLWSIVTAEDRGAESPAPAAATRAPAAHAAGNENAGETERLVLPSDGFFGAPIGSEFRYRFAATVQSRVSIGLGEAPAEQRTDLRLAGPLTVLVLDRRAHEAIVRIGLAGVTAHQGVGGLEERNAMLEELLTLPVLARVRDDGALLGVAFDPTSNAFVNNLLRSVLCGFRFVVPAVAPATWECEEQDPTGIATVRYEASARAEDTTHVRRSKLAYRPTAAGESGLTAAYTVHGVAEARLSEDLGWLRSATVHEDVTATVETARVQSSTGYRATLELEARSRRDLDDLLPVPSGVAWTTLDGADDTRAIATSTERDLAELALGDATLHDLVQEVLAITGAEPLDTAAVTAAAHELALFLELHPEAVEALAALLPSVPAFAADVLLGAAGAAGTAATQDLLAGTASDAQAPAHLRQSALDSMIQLPAPNDAVLASARALASDPYADPALRDNSLLVLGALGSREPSAESTDRRGVVAELLAREADARAEGRLAHWLLALGNTGHADTLPALERYLRHGDAELRYAAASALCRIQAPPATAALLDRAPVEHDARVRAVAVEGLAQRDAPAAFEFVSRVLERDPDVRVRSAAVSGLGRRLPFDPAVQPLLERAAREDASPAVRELAAGLLTPR